MKLIKKIFDNLNGLHYPQEYLCLAKELFDHPLHVYLIEGKKILKDITEEHLFTGYNPLILSFCSASHEKLPGDIEIAFSQYPHQPNEILKKKDAIALLSLKLIRRQLAGEHEIVYYEGTHGQHHFTSSFHQNIISLNNRFTNKKNGNVFLHDNLYKQVQIAYSVPRLISLITVSNNNLFNLFPTDLHGRLSAQYYVGSLRHGGKACEQVLASGRIAISNMNCNSYKTVYSLGKNHMQELKERENFPFDTASSTAWQLPLPQRTLNYRELQLLDSFDHGIHKLFLYQIISEKTLIQEPSSLAHIHNVYATWRHNKGLSGNYLLR